MSKVKSVLIGSKNTIPNIIEVKPWMRSPKYWIASVTPDADSQGGLARAYWPLVADNRYVVPENLKSGTVVELAWDWFKNVLNPETGLPGKKRFVNRIYRHVIAVTEDTIFWGEVVYADVRDGRLPLIDSYDISTSSMEDVPKNTPAPPKKTNKIRVTFEISDRDLPPAFRTNNTLLRVIEDLLVEGSVADLEVHKDEKDLCIKDLTVDFGPQQAEAMYHDTLHALEENVQAMSTLWASRRVEVVPYP